MTMINIRGIDKAALLAALYNNSRPMGMGIMHARPDMTVEDARMHLREEHGDDLKQMFGDFRKFQRPLYFDYLFGRVMKVDIGGDELDPSLYDRDLGKGAAARVIKHLRENGG